MKKSELARQRLNLSRTDADNEEDFEDIVTYRRDEDINKEKISELSVDLLCEYSDDSFKKLTGRPQPFKEYSEEDLKALADSISKNGIINPVVIRPDGNGRYVILAGRNRVRAARLCEMKTVPAIVRSDVDDISAAMIMLDTNLEQRPSLSYITNPLIGISVLIKYNILVIRFD